MLLVVEGNDMSDLELRPLIVLKAILFVVISGLAGFTNLLDERLVVRAAALLVCVWAACRFYYFLFYVLEKYVDPTFRYAGILALLKGIGRK
jgi:hypothetical protein